MAYVAPSSRPQNTNGVSIFGTFSEQSQRSPGFALLFCALLYLLSLMVMVPLLVLMVALVFGLNFEEVQAILGGEVQVDSIDTWVFRLIQSGNQLLTWGLVGVVMGKLLGNVRQQVGWHPPMRQDTLLPQLGIAALAMGASIPLVQWLQLDPASFRLPEGLQPIEAWMREQEDIGQKALMAILTTTNPLVLVANLITFALVPAICEEIFFRGVLQRQFARLMPDWAAVIVAGLIFSFIHFQFYGFFARAALGMLLGFLLLRSGSLWPSIVGHFTFNGLSILMAYLAAIRPDIDPSMADQTYTFPWPVVLGSLVVVTALSVAYLWLSKPQAKTPSP